MARKHHKPEEIVAKLRQADALVSQGQSVAEAIRAIGVTEVTYYRWRREFGGLKSDQVKRLKELEAEVVIESWRRHYNTARPHGSLGFTPPAPEVVMPTFAAWPVTLRRPASPTTHTMAPRPMLH